MPHSRISVAVVGLMVIAIGRLVGCAEVVRTGEPEECSSSAQCSDDGNDCTNVVCNDETGQCEIHSKTDGSQCDFMAGFGVCAGGTCQAAPCDLSPCQDGNDCTVASCPAGANSCSILEEDPGVSCDAGGDAGECDGQGHCVREPQWGTAVRIETNNNGDAQMPQVTMDPEGNAVAVWVRSDGPDLTNLWSNRFASPGGWGTAQHIESNDEGEAWAPQVASDAQGNAVAVWEHTDFSRNNIAKVWSNRFTPFGGWEAARLIENNDDGDVSSPQVAMDPQGNAVAVWGQQDGTRSNIWSNRFTPPGGWGTPEPIEANDGAARLPQTAMGPEGHAVAVWVQHDGVRYDVWSSRFTLSGGWGTAERIGTSDAGDAWDPQVTMDPQGNAVAVWGQQDGTRSNIWSNRFAPSDGWGIAERIGANDAGEAYAPEVAMGPEGYAMAVWQQSGDTRTDIWSNRLVPVGGWGTAERVEDNDDGDARLPQIAMDPQGNAVAVWAQWDGTRENIWSNGFAAFEGWGTAELIENDDGDASSPQVAMGGQRNAMAVWQQHDGTRLNIWSNQLH